MRQVSDQTSWAAVGLFSRSIPAGELADNAAMAPAPRILAASRWAGSLNAARCSGVALRSGMCPGRLETSSYGCLPGFMPRPTRTASRPARA